MATEFTQAANSDLLLKVAKNLQGSYSKLTTGDPRQWKEVPAEEKKIWLRLARTAAKILATSGGAGPGTD